MTPNRFLLGFGVLLIAGCAQRDPYQRTDVWRPTGVNASNLAAMVANPADLIAGRGESRHDTKASTIAIGHVWAAEPQPLSHGGQGGGSSTQGAAATPMTPSPQPGI